MELYLLHVYGVGFNYSFKLVSVGSVTHGYYIPSLYIMHSRGLAVLSRWIHFIASGAVWQYRIEDYD